MGDLMGVVTGQLQTILERVKPGKEPECFVLWACRGEGRGCPRNKHRTRKTHCGDCVLVNDEETLEELVKRLNRGDA